MKVNDAQDFIDRGVFTGTSYPLIKTPPARRNRTQSNRTHPRAERGDYFIPPDFNRNAALWNTHEERLAAIDHQHSISNPRDKLSAFFTWGVRYDPPKDMSQGHRAVQISVPVGTSLKDILKDTRIGQIYSATLCNTITITGMMTALIVFVETSTLAQYNMNRVTSALGGRIVGPQHTWPINEKMLRDIKNGWTRCISVHGLSTVYSLSELQALLVKPGYGRERQLLKIHRDEHNAVYLEFSSIPAADYAYKAIFQKYKGSDVVVYFQPDPCGPFSGTEFDNINHSAEVSPDSSFQSQQDDFSLGSSSGPSLRQRFGPPPAFSLGTVGGNGVAGDSRRAASTSVTSDSNIAIMVPTFEYHSTGFNWADEMIEDSEEPVGDADAHGITTVPGDLVPGLSDRGAGQESPACQSHIGSATTVGDLSEPGGQAKAEEKAGVKFSITPLHMVEITPVFAAETRLEESQPESSPAVATVLPGQLQKVADIGNTPAKPEDSDSTPQEKSRYRGRNADSTGENRTLDDEAKHNSRITQVFRNTSRAIRQVQAMVREEKLEAKMEASGVKEFAFKGMKDSMWADDGDVVDEPQPKKIKKPEPTNFRKKPKSDAPVKNAEKPKTEPKQDFEKTDGMQIMGTMGRYAVLKAEDTAIDTSGNSSQSKGKTGTGGQVMQGGGSKAQSKQTASSAPAKQRANEKTTGLQVVGMLGKYEVQKADNSGNCATAAILQKNPNGGGGGQSLKGGDNKGKAKNVVPGMGVAYQLNASSKKGTKSTSAEGQNAATEQNAPSDEKAKETRPPASGKGLKGQKGLESSRWAD